MKKHTLSRVQLAPGLWICQSAVFAELGIKTIHGVPITPKGKEGLKFFCLLSFYFFAIDLFIIKQSCTFWTKLIKEISSILELQTYLQFTL